MNKRLNLITIILFIQINLLSQTLDFKLFPINTYINNKISKLSEDNISLLSNKINAITSNLGIGGENLYNPRFVLYAKYNNIKKNVVSGTVPGILIKAEVYFFLGDAFEKTIFSNAVIPITGFGTSEDQAIVEGLRSINPIDERFKKLIFEGVTKINQYFSTQCSTIITKANSLANIKKYDEAIFTLFNIPESALTCYPDAHDLIKKIYLNKINEEGAQNLKKAKLLWSSTQNENTLDQILNLIQNINPSSSSFNELDKFINEVYVKIQSNTLKEWIERQEIRKDELQKDRYRIDLEKLQIEASKEIAIAYAKATYVTNNYSTLYNTDFYTTRIYETLFW